MKQDSKFISGAKVRLTEDLTRYHKSLVVGLEGITVGKATQAYFNNGYNDRFVKVKFKDVTIDLLWKGLELIGS